MEISLNYKCNLVSKITNQLVIRLYSTLKSQNISVTRFSRESGIPKARVYKWNQEGTNPKAEDERLILQWLDGDKSKINGENANRGTSGDQQIGENSLPGNTLETINKLADSNNKLADAALVRAKAELVNAEKEKSLVDSNADLTKLLRSIAGSVGDKHINDPAISPALLDVLAEIASGLRIHSKEEALQRLGIRFGMHESGKDMKEGIPSDGGTKSTA